MQQPHQGVHGTSKSAKMSSPLPSTMRAARVEEFAANKTSFTTAITSVKDEKTPSVPTKTQVLIRVHASSVQPGDYRWALGDCSLLGEPKPPYIPGMDVSGTVAAIGPDCSRFAVGDAVWSAGNHLSQGCFAEYVLLEEVFVAQKPDNATFAEAAALSGSALTALQALDAGRMGEGGRVLVLGASGGVGTACVQIAKAKGAEVIVAVCSKGNEELVVGLGADRHVDYVESEWWETLKGEMFDVVIDAAGGPYGWKKGRQLMNRGGRFVAVAADRTDGALTIWFIARMLGATLNRKCSNMFGAPRYSLLMADSKKFQDLDRLSEYVKQGKLKAVIERYYTLECIGEGFEHVAKGHTKGKVVVPISPDVCDLYEERVDEDTC